ncbi:unnamed protein product [Rodentolepis nana]|uniref:Ig-like domain-containing protein n=1 Tax=Rodentolepis nana TaxID=102285 RepID=A0A0R3TU89_RODNA|nr:unnamed protein product [Rodentolepis nana]
MEKVSDMKVLQKSLPRSLWPEAYGRLVVTQAPIILPGLASKIVDEGDSLTWVCQAQGSAQPKVSWTRANGRPLNLPGSPQRIYAPPKASLKHCIA